MFTTKRLSPKQRLATRLKELRAKAGWSQSGAAATIGINRAAYASYEEARAFPMLHVLARMAAVYKCTIDHLLQREKNQILKGMQNKIRLSEIPLMGYFRFPNRKTIYQAITYPTRLNPHAASRQVLIPGKKGTARAMKCSEWVVPIDSVNLLTQNYKYAQ